MSALRTLISAICIVAGALLIAWWAIASVIIDQIEDGEAVRGITERALESPAVTAALSAELSARTQEALAAQGVDVGGIGLDHELDAAIARAVGTEAFRATVLDQVEEAHGQVTDQLTDSLRTPAPLTVSVDLSDAVNARVDELGGAAAGVADVTVPPVTIEALDTAQFEQARTAYERTSWAQQWGLWSGLALLVFGLLMSHRRQWFLAKVLTVLGLLCVAFGGVVALLGPDTITTFMPGGVDGSLSTMWREVLTDEATPIVVERSLWIGGIALVAALVATLLGAALGGRRR
ncbi:hypothetical protein [Demequina aestuarii]|uniref:hypothetical protein n=1 Tax=Demequina aestuarii TaxID=327095 RepID=UPI00128E0594|nr:hypothetical protein [Demequina aestuarii]